jgi:hypothetical protein
MEEQDGEPEGARPALNNATGPPEGGSGAKSPSNAATRGSGAIRRGRKARTGRPLRPFMKFLFTAFHELNSPLFLPCSRPKQIRGLAGRRLRSGGSFKGRIWQSRQ